MKIKKYSSAKAFRAALEDRLNQISKADGVEILRLRRQIAFDRFLARVFSSPNSPWVLKGGYAMQLRFEHARATRDVDLSMKEFKALSSDEAGVDSELRKLILNEANKDLGDFFIFQVSASILDLDAAPDGGSRFLVEALVDNRSFEKFHLDVGIGDIWMEPFEKLSSKGILEFAGIASPEILAIPKEQQFSEKLHALTLPRPEGRRNSRVKDLIDMNLLINEGMNSELLKSALEATFQKRNTHKVNLKPQQPPIEWIKTYEILANDSGLNPDLSKGFEQLSEFLAKI
jgi:Nucleotidyl transferase AbiEii toxin, Type IV TA system